VHLSSLSLLFTQWADLYTNKRSSSQKVKEYAEHVSSWGEQMFIVISIRVIVFSLALSLSFGVDQTFRRGVNCASTQQKDETLLSKAQTVAILRRRRRRRRKTKTF
tara:strand:- start:157 stop:474 length:318 start_codon:yes stop_codon:yes gene_type:complete